MRNKYTLWLSTVGCMIAVGVLYASPLRIRFDTQSVTEEVLFHAHDGRPLKISVWRGETTDSQQHPAVLFVHGGTERGPYELAYRTLCKTLAYHGLTVAAPVLRGYRSDEPRDPDNHFELSHWDPLPDIAGAYTFLRDDPLVDPDNIVVVGHSSGGGFALLFGLSELNVAGIISLSRLDMESRMRHWPGYFDNARRSTSKMFGLDPPMSVETFQEFADSLIFTFAQAREALRDPEHPRILFAIGDRERLSDRQWLAAYAAQAAGTAEYYVFPGLTHMLNFWPLGWNVWFYDRRVVKQVASVITLWVHGRSIGELSEESLLYSSPASQLVRSTIDR